MNTPAGRTKKAQQLKQDEAFYYEHAGYGYDPKIETAEQGRKRCAKALARAYRKAYDAFVYWDWQEGDECIGCDCGNKECACASGSQHDCYTCILRNSEGEVLASLGSICEPSKEYRRVIEAELALEAFGSN